MAIGVNDPVGPFKAAAVAFDPPACLEAQAFWDDCIGRALTVRDMAAEMADIDPDWCLWCRFNLAPVLTAAAKGVLLLEALRNRPRQEAAILAAHLWRTRKADLTQGERDGLRERWNNADLPDRWREYMQSQV